MRYPFKSILKYPVHNIFMSNALLKLAIVFMFVSLISATSQFAIPLADAPAYCASFNPATQPVAGAGTAPIDNGILGGAPPITYANVLNNSVILSVMALVISFAVIAIAYMISRLAPTLGIRNWLQAEYWEVTKTAIIIVVIFAMITIIGNIATALYSAPVTLTGGDITPLINGAETYLCNVNYNLMQTWGWMGLLGAGTGFWANLKMGNYIIYFALPSETGGFAILSGSTFIPFNNWMLQTGNPMIGPYGSIIGDTINLLLFPFTVINLIGVDIVPSMAVVGLTFFIPLGLIFRSLPFIRGIGGTLIAIGLGLAVIFPATLVMFNGIFINYITQAVAIAPPPPPTVPPATGLTFCPFAPPGGGSAFGSGLATLTCDTLPSLLDISQLLPAANFASNDDAVGHLNGANVFSDTAIYQYMDIILATGAYVIVQLVVITIDLVIVYAITDSVARALGGSVRLQLGGKLRIAS
jgi:hypothetical protein